MFSYKWHHHAGLNAVPNQAALSEYSCRADPRFGPALMDCWHDGVHRLGVELGASGTPVRPSRSRPGDIVVSLGRRANNPLLIAAGFAETHQPVPWLGNRRRRIRFF
ncbi:MAG: hypothetical protein OXI81_09045 [Paracoccaceae bacterium]|nr:hypothetical protein [Paracoccaceae bacterium]